MIRRLLGTFRKKPPFGVNLCGFLTGELGLGEAARGLGGALEQAGIPLAANNVAFDIHRQGDHRWADRLTTKNPYRFNLICLNSLELQWYAGHISPSYFNDRYNIGVWYWEQETLPESWLPGFRLVDELWVATDFVRRSLEPHTSKPIIKIPPAVVVPEGVESHVAENGPALPYTFLLVFDGLSSLERKNPLGAVQAFQMAFPDPRDDSVALVIKCSNYGAAKSPQAALLGKAIAGDPRITLIPDYLSRREVWELIARCSCFVSLHRSEGLGLGIIEAMMLGKPVVATAYGGNMDYMTPQNSFLVDYELVTLKEDDGPYLKSTFWAEPNVGQATVTMQSLAARKVLSVEGAVLVGETFSPERISAMTQQRIEQLS